MKKPLGDWFFWMLAGGVWAAAIILVLLDYDRRWTPPERCQTDTVVIPVEVPITGLELKSSHLTPGGDSLFVYLKSMR